MTRPRSDILVKNGIVVDGGRMTRTALLIEDASIVDHVSDPDDAMADTVVDAGGQYVLPGLIDAHLHPVYADRIDTLSRAAATGGITTLIPYIGAVAAWGQGGGLVDAVSAFIEEGQASSILDFGVHATLTQNVMENVERSLAALTRMGVISFKAFTAYKKRGMQLQDEELLAVMRLVAGLGGLFATHSENGPMLDDLERAAVLRGDVTPECYPPTHPSISEAEAVFRVLSLARVTGCAMYLPHVSAAQTLEVIRLFKKWHPDQRIHVETCPHYLTLTDAALQKRGTLAKMSPPLRKTEDIRALWQAVDDGLVEVIASDAAGHTIAANEPLFDAVFDAPHGTPGVDTAFTVTYDEGVNTGKVTLPRLVETFCENPARIFGLYPRKGTLAKGADADLVLFDPGAAHTIAAKNPHTHVDYSLYENRACLGAPTLVMQRGRVIMQNGDIEAKPGQGRFLPATPAPQGRNRVP